MSKKLLSAFCIIMLLSSSVTARAATKTVTSYASQGTIASANITISQGAYLSGSVICRNGGILGNPTRWRADLRGDLAIACTQTAASFGRDGSVTNVMRKSKFVVNSYVKNFEKSKGAPHHYAKASTRLYY